MIGLNRDSAPAPYALFVPDEITSAAVFSSPHSGAEYPQRFLAQSLLGLTHLRSSEDAFVDRLFDFAPQAGAPLLAARFPRAYVDVNRAADELDPAVVEGAARRGTNARIAAGLGVIPRVVADSRVIHAGKISLSEAQLRLRTCYHPYHARLAALLERQRASFGRAVLFDLHSMPHEALMAVPRLNGRLPEIVLGDRFGASCAPWVAEAAMAAFRSAGFVVARNTPFAGGHITQAYGLPAQGLHALQIEVDRALYMDERRIEPKPGFEALRCTLAGVVSRLAALAAPGQELAAE